MNKQFQEITGCQDESIATYFLSRNKNKLTESINDFYNNPHLLEEFNKKKTKKASSSINNRYAAELGKIFQNYSEVDGMNNEVIGIDGTIKYIEDLGYEVEDVEVLGLAYFLDSKEMGVFKKDKFIENWSSISVHNLSSMKKFMQDINTRLQDKDSEFFKKVYKFVYNFVLEKGEKKLNIEDALEYWKLLLDDSEELNKFTDYLVNHSGKDKISKDEWNMIPVFIKECKNGLLNNYSDDGAWPLLMDEYVEYRNKNN